MHRCAVWLAALLMLAGCGRDPIQSDVNRAVTEAPAFQEAVVSVTAGTTSTATSSTTTTATAVATTSTVSTTSTAAPTTTTEAPAVTLDQCLKMLTTLLPSGVDPARYADANEERCHRAMAISCAEARENYRTTMAEAEKMAEEDEQFKEFLPATQRGASMALDISCGVGTAATMVGR